MKWIASSREICHGKIFPFCKACRARHRLVMLTSGFHRLCKIEIRGKHAGESSIACYIRSRSDVQVQTPHTNTTHTPPTQTTTTTTHKQTHTQTHTHKIDPSFPISSLQAANTFDEEIKILQAPTSSLPWFVIRGSTWIYQVICPEHIAKSPRRVRQRRLT